MLMTIDKHIKQLDPFIPVSKFGEKTGGLQTTASLRWDIFNNRNSIRDKCILKRGNRLYVDTAAYLSWLKENSR